MGLLSDFTAYVDSLKRRGANTARELVADPMGLLGRNVSAFSESLPAAPGEPQNEMLARPGMQDWATGVAMNAPTMGLLGHTVYHGSPHKFDKFDASKIGTGEGAQAYGHGLYFADNPTVAAGYKESLSARLKDRLTVDGKRVDPDSMFGRAAEDVSRIGVQATLQKIDDNIKFNEKYAPDMAELYRDVRKQVAALDPARVALHEGALYKVDLPDEQIAKMLDWDKPLSQQAPEVRAAIAKAQMMDESVFPHYTGETLYQGEMNARGPFKPSGWPETRASVAVSEQLRQAGIPGIRYLDQGSRGAGTGTSNYVVFPGMEHLLKILERE